MFETSMLKDKMDAVFTTLANYESREIGEIP